MRPFFLQVRRLFAYNPLSFSKTPAFWVTKGGALVKDLCQVKELFFEWRSGGRQRSFAKKDHHPCSTF